MVEKHRLTLLISWDGDFLDTNNLLDFDELKIYFGEDYYPSKNIKISQPSIGDILAYGDTKFYSMVNSICGNPTMFRLQLWNMGINWNDLSDFDFFFMMIRNYTPNETSLLFGDLNLSWFEKFHDNKKDCDILIYIPRNEQGEVLDDFEYNDDSIVIDEIIYIKIVEYIRYMFNIHPKVEHAKNKVTAEAIIWEEEMNLNVERQKHKEDKIQKSVLFPMISAILNHPGFKYKKNELREIGIVEFMDSVQRLQIYESTRALLSGMYSGMCDTSKIPKEDFNFMRSINS